MLPEGYGECRVCGTPCRGGYCDRCEESPIRCEVCRLFIYWEDNATPTDSGGFICEECTINNIQWITITPEYVYDELWSVDENYKGYTLAASRDPQNSVWYCTILDPQLEEVEDQTTTYDASAETIRIVMRAVVDDILTKDPA